MERRSLRNTNMCREQRNRFFRLLLSKTKKQKNVYEKAFPLAREWMWIEMIGSTRCWSRSNHKCQIISPTQIELTENNRINFYLMTNESFCLVVVRPTFPRQRDTTHISIWMCAFHILCPIARDFARWPQNQIELVNYWIPLHARALLRTPVLRHFTMAAIPFRRSFQNHVCGCTEIFKKK